MSVSFLRYMEEEYGIHHKYVGHLSAEKVKEMLAEGHIVELGVGCEGYEGLPYCKAEGVEPRCHQGHTIMFYKYEDGIFWAKDSASRDGAAMCLYPEGPLTVTHTEGIGCLHGGETVTLDNYADAFFRLGYCSDIWVDEPYTGPIKKPAGVTLPKDR